MNRNPQQVLPHLGFILVYLIWGINVSSMKIGGEEWDPFLFNGIRFLGTIPFLWAYAIYYCRKHSLRVRMRPRDLLLLILLGALTAAMEVALAYGLQFSNSANGAVLGRGFMPVVTVLISLALHEIRLTWRVLAGLPLALFGVFLIVAGGKNGFHIGPDTLHGDVFLLARSFAGAGYLIVMNRLVRRYPVPYLVAMELTFSAAFLLPAVLWKADASYLAAVSSAGWISLVYTAVFASIFAFPVHNWSLGRLGPFKSSVYGYMMPFMSAVAGYLLLHESLTWNQAAGGVGVLLALYLVQRDRIRMIREGAIRPAVPVYTTSTKEE